MTAEPDDFGWKSLGQRPWSGGGAGKSLRDYWRRGPRSGREKSRKGDDRLDREMLESGELVERDGRIWHVVHLQARDHDSRVLASDILQNRLDAARQNGDATAFCGVRFPDVVKISGTVRIDLSHAHFENEVRFTSAEIAAGSKFDHAVFSAVAWLKAKSFEDNVSFVGATFKQDVHFRDSSFGMDISFKDAVFLAQADFCKCRFGARASFSGSQFELADFLDAQFHGDADFADALFSGHCNFSRASFKETSFLDASFLSRATFHQARFLGPVDFSVEPFQRPGKVAITNDISFLQAVFAGEADFGNRTFSGAARFERTCWRDAPLFHGATFQQEVTFAAAAFPCVEKHHWKYVRPFWKRPDDEMDERIQDATGCRKWQDFDDHKKAAVKDMSPPLDARWPWSWVLKIPFCWRKFHGALAADSLNDLRHKPSEDYICLEGRYQDLELAFRTLQLAMGNTKARIEEARFFKLEQLARRRRLDRTEVSLTEKLLSKIYGSFADYGNSAFRPLGWWCGLIATTTLFFWVASYGGLQRFFAALDMDFRTPVDPQLGQAFLMSIRGAIEPFFIWKVERSDAGAADAWPSELSILAGLEADPARAYIVRLVSTFESLASLALLFLFLLALRRRFQIS